MLVYIKPLSIFPKLHSDTIFGALLSAINELYPEIIDDLLLKFQNTPPFLISSAFPYVFTNKNEKIRFYPKIITNQGTGDSLSNEKKFKKVDYIEEETFFKLASGEIKESDLINELKEYKINDKLLFKKNTEIQGKVKDATIPNNRINRITGVAEPFYSEGYNFNNIGLFFLVEFNEEDFNENIKYETIIKSAIKFLKDRGFGKDISTGKGHFNYEFEDTNLKDLSLEKGNYFISLSRFIPNDEDLNKIDKYSAYEIGLKRGKNSRGENKKQIRFFSEGSTFPDYKKFYGKIVQVGDKTPAIEYGFAFPLKYNNVNTGEV